MKFEASWGVVQALMIASYDCMGLSDLFEFLTAVVVRPELIMSGEWLPVIWSEGESEFGSDAHMESIISLATHTLTGWRCIPSAIPERFPCPWV
jgi:yecA family protein